MGKKSSFYSSAEGEPHRQRTKEILKKHPEIRQLIGRNPNTFFFILGLVGLQIYLAYILLFQGIKIDNLITTSMIVITLFVTGIQITLFGFLADMQKK
ncbi:hypothetical protein IH970_11855 [candidate division KSB1 bacterium]|nr:hypothetical protein [candidate division KSB1 bacterium]